MSHYKKIQFILLCSFLFSIFLIVLRLEFSRYIPIIFGLLFYPFFIFRWMKTAFNSSSYLKKNHIELYNKYKSSTYSMDGKIVSLRSISDSEIKTINDPILLIFKTDDKKNAQLMFFSFLGIFLLALLTVILAMK
ncbi:hypothetical protein SGQ83_07640 [Flavobacterium sp. Fl-318]|uniref:DUF3899 domain-containing protein n=1 Tax=Flavobacterium cupriresistens TaxID=2893885 RepID=A0ABU4R9H5_9FLAO|nr:MULTISPECIES: hypothetical protein [unclassified Flavobacterium]MDX6189214.1 hypothetical protein [Flavobacterium sp. Fl-318]UFH41310.1 hypothetical protein LNP23_16010 [Flavobacterium sp. F-323]